MASTLVFLVVRRVLGLVGLGPTPDDKDVEIAVLRHQLAVPRPRYGPTDRLILATLSRLLCRPRRDRYPLPISNPMAPSPPADLGQPRRTRHLDPPARGPRPGNAVARWHRPRRRWHAVGGGHARQRDSAGARRRRDHRTDLDPPLQVHGLRARRPRRPD